MKLTVKTRMLSIFVAISMVLAIITAALPPAASSAATPLEQLYALVNSPQIMELENNGGSFGIKGISRFQKALNYAKYTLYKASAAGNVSVPLGDDEYISAYLMLSAAASEENLYKIETVEELEAYQNSLRQTFDSLNILNTDMDRRFTDASWSIFVAAYYNVTFNTRQDTATLTNLYDDLKDAFEGLVPKTIITQAEYNALLNRARVLPVFEENNPLKPHRNLYTDERRPKNFNKETDHITADATVNTARWGIAWLEFDRVSRNFSWEPRTRETTNDKIVKAYHDMLRVVEYIENFEPDEFESATVADFRATRLAYHNQLVDAENFLANLAREEWEIDITEEMFARGEYCMVCAADVDDCRCTKHIGTCNDCGLAQCVCVSPCNDCGFRHCICRCEGLRSCGRYKNYDCICHERCLGCAMYFSCSCAELCTRCGSFRDDWGYCLCWGWLVEYCQKCGTELGEWNNWGLNHFCRRTRVVTLDPAGGTIDASWGRSPSANSPFVEILTDRNGQLFSKDLPIPVRDGYMFMGWALTNAPLTVNPSTGLVLMVNEDITLRARWNKLAAPGELRQIETAIVNFYNDVVWERVIDGPYKTRLLDAIDGVLVVVDTIRHPQHNVEQLVYAPIGGGINKMQADRIVGLIGELHKDPLFNASAQEIQGSNHFANQFAAIAVSSTNYIIAKARFESDIVSIKNHYAMLRLNPRNGYGALGELYRQIERELSAFPNSDFSWIERERHPNSGDFIADSPNRDFIVVFDVNTGGYLRSALNVQQARINPLHEDAVFFTAHSAPDLRRFIEIRFAPNDVLHPDARLVRPYQIAFTELAWFCYNENAVVRHSIRPELNKPLSDVDFEYFTSKTVLKEKETAIAKSRNAWPRTFEEVLTAYRAILSVESFTDTNITNQTNGRNARVDAFWRAATGTRNESSYNYSIPPTQNGSWAFALRALTYALHDYTFTSNEALTTREELESLINRAEAYDSPAFLVEFNAMRNLVLSARIQLNAPPSPIQTPNQRMNNGVYVPLESAVSAFEAQTANLAASVAEAFKLIYSAYNTGDEEILDLAKSLAYEILLIDSDYIWNQANIAEVDIIKSGRFGNIVNKDCAYLAYRALEMAMVAFCSCDICGCEICFAPDGECNICGCEDCFGGVGCLTCGCKICFADSDGDCENCSKCNPCCIDGDCIECNPPCCIDGDCVECNPTCCINGDCELCAIVCTHSWSAWTVSIPATCETARQEIRTCTQEGCNESMTRIAGSVLGHVFGVWTTTTLATCTSAGEQTRNCTRDNCTEFRTREIAPQPCGRCGCIECFPQFGRCKDKDCHNCNDRVCSNPDCQNPADCVIVCVVHGLYECEGACTCEPTCNVGCNCEKCITTATTSSGSEVSVVTSSSVDETSASTTSATTASATSAATASTTSATTASATSATTASTTSATTASTTSATTASTTSATTASTTSTDVSSSTSVTTASSTSTDVSSSTSVTTASSTSTDISSSTSVTTASTTSTAVSNSTSTTTANSATTAVSSTTTAASTTDVTTTTPVLPSREVCNVCKICVSGNEPVVGYILGEEKVSTADALEILKFYVKLDNAISRCGNARFAAQIIACPIKDEDPSTADALEILKYIVKLDNRISNRNLMLMG